MTGPLVLPKDVQIVPLASLSANVRARIAGENHEFALTRPNSRAPSKVVDAQGAEFLREFEKPTTLVEAIVRFSKTVGREPAQVLDEVYPFLESCLVAKLLVEPGIDAEVIRASFEKGVVVANLKVLECIQALDDTELYCVGADDLKAALKIARPGAGPQVARILKRESRDEGLPGSLLRAKRKTDGHTLLPSGLPANHAEKLQPLCARVRMSSFPCRWSRCARISSMLTLIYTGLA